MTDNKPTIKIKGKVQDMTKKERNIKPKKSNFLLTINTKQQYKEDDEGLKNDIEVFDVSVKESLNNIEQYINLPETDKWDDHFIKDIDIDYVLLKRYIFVWLLLSFLSSLHFYLSLRLFQIDLKLFHIYFAFVQVTLVVYFLEVLVV